MLPIRDHESSGRFPFVTIGIIAANAVVFLLELTDADPEAFVFHWALVPARISFGDPLTLYPFLTSQFLHAGFAHVGFNMWYLWIFGDNIEGRFGHAWYFLFYILSGVVAAAAQLFVSSGSAIPMLGASGAVAGALGAYLVLFPRHRVDALLPTPLGLFHNTYPAGIVLFFWFITQFLNGTASVVAGTAASGGVAFWAHIGGFVFGWVVGKVVNPALQRRA